MSKLKKKRKIRLGKRIAEALDLPDEAVSGQPKLTLHGREILLVENHKGIFVSNSEKGRP